MEGVVLLPDISEYQPEANLSGIKSQNGGAVIIRVGYGAEHLDKAYTSHRAAARAAGFQFVGLYHYVTAGEDIVTQAHQFYEWVGSLAPGEIPILDLEEGSGSQLARATTWLNIVDNALGLSKLALNRKSWLYSGDYFAQHAGLEPIFDSLRHTWVAAYGNTEPSLPHTLWQSTDGKIGSHRVSWLGCGYCDTNFTSYTLAQLASMAFQPTSPASTSTDWLGDIVSSLPALKQGDNSNDVRTLQGLLCARGHAVVIDGDFGPRTAATLKSVQDGWKLTVTGQTDPRTWVKLLNR